MNKNKIINTVYFISKIRKKEMYKELHVDMAYYKVRVKLIVENCTVTYICIHPHHLVSDIDNHYTFPYFYLERYLFPYDNQIRQSPIKYI